MLNFAGAIIAVLGVTVIVGCFYLIGEAGEGGGLALIMVAPFALGGFIIFVLGLMLQGIAEIATNTRRTARYHAAQEKRREE